MAKLAWVWLLLISISQPAQSDEENASQNWLNPNGHDENFKDIYTIGDPVTIRWTGWDSAYTDYYMDSKTIANLYLTSWNSSDYSYSRILASTVNISKSGYYDWKVYVEDEPLSQTSEYDFTFIADGESYSTDIDHFYSPGILIHPQSTTSSSTSGTTPSPTSTTVPTTTSKAASSSTDGLSTGGKAGIGIGVGIGGVALLSALGFLLLRRRRRQSSQEVTGLTEVSGPSSVFALSDGFSQETKPPPQELSTGYQVVPPAELSSASGR